MKEKIAKIFKAVWKFIKKNWLFLVGIFITVFLVKKGFTWLSSLGKPDKPSNFVPIDEDTIAVKDPVTGEWKSVELPEGYKSDDVVAAGFDTHHGKIMVEVKHEEVDRKHPTTPDDDGWVGGGD